MARRAETDPAGRAALRQFASRIVGIEKRVEGLAKSRLSSSSLEAAAIDSYAEDGTLNGVIGTQYDGAAGFLSVNGPPPPVPGAPVINAVPTGVQITFDGTWADGGTTVAPSDFSHFEVHASTTATTGIMFDTLKGQITSARGGQVVLPTTPDQPIYAWIVARTQSGKWSVGASAGPVAGGYVPQESIDPDVIASIGGNTIYRQDTAPTGTIAIGDLWLDTPENIPYRYEGEPAGWVVARDAGIAEAIDTAFEAQGVAEQAGIDALAATSAAGSAQTAAGNAQTTANNAAQAAIDASTLAGTKTTTFRQDNQPATTGRTVGDIWIETDQGNRQWVWTANNQWTLTTFGAGAISATARELGAITTYRQSAAPTSGMIVGDFWIDSDDNKLYRYEGATPTWVAVQDAGIQAAITSASNAAALADGKMRIFTQADAPTGLVAGDAGDMWIETDNGNKVWTWDGTTLAWVPRQLGNAAIQPQSLVASDVIATGTVSAALLEAVMILTNTIVAGPVLGEHTEISPAGVSVFVPDPGSGLPEEATRLGRYLQVVDVATNKVTGALTDKGFLSVTSIDVADDTMVTFGGTSVADRDWEKAWGVQGYGYFTELNSAPNRTNGETDTMELGIQTVDGRGYYLTMEPVEVYAATGTAAYLRWRRTIDGSRPTVTSPVFREWLIGNLTNTFSNWTMPTHYMVGDGNFWRLLLTYGVANGSTGIAISRYHDSRVTITDIGPSQPNIGTLTNGAGGTTSSTGAKVKRTTTFTASWSRSWRGDGSVRTDIGSDMYQGRYDSFNGLQRSAWGVGSGMASTLSGATIEKAEAYLYAEHWYSYAGGTARVGHHGYNGVPPSSPSQNGTPFSVNFSSRGQGKWFTLPSSWHAGLQDGTIQGLVLFQDSTAGQYYGRFSGQGSTYAPRFRVTYTK